MELTVDYIIRVRAHLRAYVRTYVRAHVRTYVRAARLRAAYDRPKAGLRPPTTRTGDWSAKLRETEVPLNSRTI